MLISNPARPATTTQPVMPALRLSITYEVLIRCGDGLRFDGEADLVGDGFYFARGESAHAVCEADEE